MEMIPDIPRLYTGIAEWLACVVILQTMHRRVGNILFLMISTAALVIQCGFLMITADIPAGLFWIACMVAAVLFMFSFIMLCSDLTVLAGVYCTLLAFMVSEFAASLEWQLHTWSTFFFPVNRLTAAAILVLIYFPGFFIFYRLLRPQFTAEFLKRLAWKDVLLASIIVLITFSLSNISFYLSNSPFSGQVMTDIFTMRTLADLAGLTFFLAQQNRISEFIAFEELSATRKILDSQYEQYRYYQESEEMLHMMQHDLKHQIEGLRGNLDASLKEEWIDLMSNELEKWWIPQKTGNPVFDTILSAKYRKARSLKVRITCVADGKLLDMLHVVDICTIFGNALDNALESVVMIPDEEKRLIHISVSSQKNFIFIRVANTMGNTLLEENGVLRTTKADRKHHGFGLKGIQYVVDKYDGNVSHSIKDGWFELSILIPVR